MLPALSSVVDASELCLYMLEAEVCANSIVNVLVSSYAETKHGITSHGPHNAAFRLIMAFKIHVCSSYRKQSGAVNVLQPQKLLNLKGAFSLRGPCDVMFRVFGGSVLHCVRQGYPHIR